MMMMTIMVIMMKLCNKVFSEELNICVVLSVQASLRSRLCGARWGFHSIPACLALAALPKCQILLYCKNKSKPHCSRLFICQISFYRPLMHQIHISESIIFNLILLGLIFIGHIYTLDELYSAVRGRLVLLLGTTWS